MSNNTTTQFDPTPIDEQRLRSDPQFRWDHAKAVIDFNKQDWTNIQNTEPHLRGEFRDIVEALYEEFMKYEPTARFYLHDDGSLDEESYEHRVEGFVMWLERVFDWPEDERYIKYLKDVAEIHTGNLGFEEMVVSPFYTGPTFTIVFKEIAKILGNKMDEPEQLAQAVTSWEKFFRLQENFMRWAYEQT